MAAKFGQKKAPPQKIFEAFERRAKGESLAEISAAVGYHPSAVSRWLSGKSHKRVAPNLRMPAESVEAGAS